MESIFKNNVFSAETMERTEELNKILESISKLLGIEVYAIATEKHIEIKALDHNIVLATLNFKI